MNKEQELRLECIKLVLTHFLVRIPEEVIALSEEVFNFIVGGEVYAAEMKKRKQETRVANSLPPSE